MLMDLLITCSCFILNVRQNICILAMQWYNILKMCCFSPLKTLVEEKYKSNRQNEVRSNSVQPYFVAFKYMQNTINESL